MRNLLFVFLAACGGSSPAPLPIIDAFGTTSPTAPSDGRLLPPDAGVFLDAPADAPSTTPFPDAL